MEDNAECMLVIIGATPEGKKELLGFQVGIRESAQSWRELLVDIKNRGLSAAPEIAVGPSRDIASQCTGGQRTVPWIFGWHWAKCIHRHVTSAAGSTKP